MLLGVEVVLTHWFYLYIPWFFPFVAYAVLAARPEPAPATPPEVDEHEPRALVAAG